ncbi:helix-turn-helix domain-containing protein [Kribbella sp. NBC_01510]|uniref:AlkA N-terminal domain-containing protein n=1 Tax=Kribbella sp. NBC_01510 TaxID=2903581 RepID=UPI003869F179
MTTYSAVRTTGIYCRPGCGAKPLAENVRTFELPAAAEAAGYRACLRCRPYRVAGTVADDAPELVCRAVQLIIAGVLDESGEAALGARLGLSARHLRRMFHEHLGVTPDQFARSRRAHFARRLLDDSELGIADIAFAAGFGSLRQFNRAMQEVFRASPRELRDRRRRTDRLVADGGLVLRLPYTPPYDWDAMSAYLAERAIPGVESVEDGIYRRTIALDGDPGLLEIGPGGSDHLLLRAHLPYWEGVIHVVDRAARLVGLDAEPVLAKTLLSGDPVIGPLIAARPGVRVPGAWGPFEVAVQAVVRDQLPRDDAYDVLHKLVEVHGMPVPGLSHSLTRAFPGPQALTEAELVGPLAREVAAGNVVLDGGEDAEALIASLEAVPGVSTKAAHHVAMRLGARDAWPFDDDAERLRPWRSLAAVHRVLSDS